MRSRAYEALLAVHYSGATDDDDPLTKYVDELAKGHSGGRTVAALRGAIGHAVEDFCASSLVSRTNFGDGPEHIGRQGHLDRGPSDSLAQKGLDRRVDVLGSHRLLTIKQNLENSLELGAFHRWQALMRRCVARVCAPP